MRPPAPDLGRIRRSRRFTWLRPILSTRSCIASSSPRITTFRALRQERLSVLGELPELLAGDQEIVVTHDLPRSCSPGRSLSRRSAMEDLSHPHKSSLLPFTNAPLSYLPRISVTSSRIPWSTRSSRRAIVFAFEQIDENSRDEGHQRETDQNDRLLRSDLSNRLLDPLTRQPRNSRSPPSRPTLHFTGMVGVKAKSRTRSRPSSSAASTKDMSNESP